MCEETIAVVDFGGQYAHLVARRVRALGVHSRIVQPEGFDPAGHGEVVGVILSGGPGSVTSAGHATVSFDPRRCGVPVLGLCYGHQLLAALCGGEVRSDGRREYGMAEVECDARAVLFGGLAVRQQVWMSHGDHVERLPGGWRATARSGALEVAAFESDDARLFGLQFHPEVTHTRAGRAVLENFLACCTARRSWRPAAQAERIRARIRAGGGARPLFVLASGGVDSLVALALCIQAVGPERVLALHVDTGFMRAGESAEVAAALRGLGFVGLRVADASGRFHAALRGVVDPEEKRRVIGRLFVEVMEEELKRVGMGDDWLLVQGTIYPDSIESGATRGSARIKTHHNRVEEIERLMRAGRVLEPLIDLYKDEVRELGLSLGLPGELVERHPFPGPGLAIRILCSEGSGGAVAEADERAAGEIASGFGLCARVLPVRSVGVQGDCRTYRHPVVLWRTGGGPVGWDVAEAAATELANRVCGVNRVVLAVEDLEGRELRVRPTWLDRTAVARLQELDLRVRRRLAARAEVWQVPVVTLPLFDAGGRQAYVVRPVTSTDAMTADFYRLEPDALLELCAEIDALGGFGPMLYDVSSKPPATIEWE